MSSTLVMGFLTESGNKASLRFKDVKEAATDAEISAAMDAVIAKNIFNTSSGNFAAKDSAYIEEKTITDVVL